MIEQLSDSGLTGGGAGDSSLPSNDRHLPLPVKKQVLRNLPNENNVTATKSIGNSTLPKEKLPVSDPNKVSGAKRPSSEVTPLPSQAAVNANGNLVYVRRKTEPEVGKISSSVTASNNTDLQPSVKAPVSNERIQPSSTVNNPHVEACKISSSKPSLNSPAKLVNLPNESPLPRPLRSDSIMPSVEDKSLLHQPAGKAGNTMSSTDKKSPLPHPLGKSGSSMGNSMASTENKSPLPNPLGKSGNIMASNEYKSPLPQSLGKSDDIMSSTDNKFPPPQTHEDSCIVASSAEKRSSLSHPTGNSGLGNSSVENRSPLPRSLGQSANIMSPVENNHIPPVSITATLDLAKESNPKHLPPRHSPLQTSLRGLDRSGHEAYLQMLRTLSSAELSRLAFELEARSIQLSLEEAREIGRLEMLNVMGKSSRPSKSPTVPPEK